MRYYVGMIHTPSPAPTLGEPKQPPESMFWTIVDAESPIQAQNIGEPLIHSVLHSTTQHATLLMTRSQWITKISAYTEFPQGFYQVALIVNGQPCQSQRVRVSSPMEAVEDVNGLLPEPPQNTPRLLQATLDKTRPPITHPTANEEHRTSTLEKLLMGT